MSTPGRSPRRTDEPSDRSGEPPAPAEPDDAERPQRPPLPVLGLDRRSITLVAAVLVAGWLVFVFGRAVSDAAAATDHAAQLRAGNAVLETQLLRRQAELATIQSPAFVQLEARAFGLGNPREQVFALQPGAPTPPAITPLGDDGATHPVRSPLDVWLDLLFGG